MLKPEPRQFIHDARDVELRIPKLSPIIYAQLPFYLKHLVSTEDMVETIQETRAVCKKFEEKGLPNYPRGIPFTFWEQYINLRRYLLLALGSILGAILTILTILLFNLWAALVVVFVLFVIIIELVGLMGLLGIKLSAIPAVLLIVAVGLGVDFAAHILIGFITSIGNRNRRVGIAVKNMMAPIVDGAVSTILGIAMLAFSEFDFIVKYFFYILCLLILLGVFNGLVLLPVILSIMGPPGEDVFDFH
ncbi:protein patched homolog 1-like [Artemia franciscana]|uniref:protein patched homolog 1-like n=1 Tax=Artemia franciscana TaxID=6661 RepID=UPI0032DAA9F1